jgi:hypothetical protein
MGEMRRAIAREEEERRKQDRFTVPVSQVIRTTSLSISRFRKHRLRAAERNPQGQRSHDAQNRTNF